MIRRRRLIITPGPGRELPDPEDPSLPQVSPNQPEADPPVPTPPPDTSPTTPDREPRDSRGVDSWLRGLGVQADREARHAWLEPHLWAALRARVDASAAERQSRWIQPRR
jgi:hypothetical protein